MRAFQTVIFALVAASTATAQGFTRTYSLGGYGSGLSYGNGYRSSYTVPVSSGFGGYSYGSGLAYSVGAAPSVQYVAAAPAVAVQTVRAAPVAVQTVRAAPVASVAYAVQAAPAAASVQYTTGQVANIGVVATAPASGPSVHEVHTGSGSKTIRLEEFQGGDQVIRVHEQASQGPQVAQVLVPGEQSHIRVVNRNGPTQVQRVVHRQQTQVVDVQKPGRPGARIVQVVKGESPAPTVEFVNEGGPSHQVYYADDAAAGGYSAGGYSAGGYSAGGAGFSVAAAPISTQYVAAAPVAVQAAPAVSYATQVRAVPAATIAVQAAPVVSYATQVQSAPAVTYVASAPYAGLGYSTGATGYATRLGSGYGQSIDLDSYKKASAKKASKASKA